MWNECRWLRMGLGGGILWPCKWNLYSVKTGSCWPSLELFQKDSVSSNNFYADVSICSPTFHVYKHYYNVRILGTSCLLAVTLWAVSSRVSLQLVWGLILVEKAEFCQSVQAHFLKRTTTDLFLIISSLFTILHPHINSVFENMSCDKSTYAV